MVFGDIGTSPLYALQTVFHADHGEVPTSPTAVYGVLSLVFWAVTLIVSIKYVTFIMRADNDGEGGIMALIALIQRAGLPRRSTQLVLISLGIFGAALFYGDGMITPAISVLSAVEGLEVVSPSLDSLVVPIALAILTGLFVIQRFGTGSRRPAVRPGDGAVVRRSWRSPGSRRSPSIPASCAALSPSYAVEFFVEHGGTAFVALGSVVLAVTGAEALYADMGHFGRPPIRRAWFFLVFPALTLNYLGQGALIVDDPDGDREPVLPAVPRVEPDPDGRPGHVRDGDRLPGGDLRRVLGHAPGRRARVPASADDPPHVPSGDRAGLRAGGQLGHLRRGRRARRRLRLLDGPGLRLRHRGDRDAGDRHDPVLLRRPVPLEEAALAGHRRRGGAS